MNVIFNYILKSILKIFKKGLTTFKIQCNISVSQEDTNNLQEGTGEQTMMLHEANERLKKTQITEEQLWGLNSLYILLDLDKNDFCKIVDVVGVDKLLKKQGHYERLDKAEQELVEKERYLKAKTRLEELEAEKQDLEQVVNNYKPIK